MPGGIIPVAPPVKKTLMKKKMVIYWGFEMLNLY